MITYKLCPKDKDGNEVACVKRSDGWVIPFDPANTDYQQYLAWLEAGNTPIPADEENKT